MLSLSLRIKGHHWLIRAIENVIFQVPVRNASMHRRWMRPYLKDLFHRRAVLGPDPIISRSAEENWNYPSEISAFSHRIHIPEVDNGLIVQALTDKNFIERKDVSEGASLAQPSKEQQVMQSPSNEELAEKGSSLFRHILLTYLRAHWPLAPEEFIIAAAVRIASNDVFTETANHLGIQNIVRTAEFPPSEVSLQTAMFSLIGIMDVMKARNFIRTFFLPRLLELPLEDVLPFRKPFPILQEYMRKWEKIDDIEARVIGSGGLSTSMPYYQIAIYANKKRLIGQSAGEQQWVALDLAAQNALLRLWKIMDVPRVFPFKFEEVYASRFDQAQKQNHSLKDVCSESTDIELYTNEELAMDPLDPIEMAQQYYTKIKPEIGLPHRKRLRHMFARGSLQRFSKRHVVKPQPHNI